MIADILLAVISAVTVAVAGVVEFVNFKRHGRKNSRLRRLILY